jgi:CRP-like cAMP-binding protein
VAKVQHFSAGDYIIRKNELGDAFYIILEGEVHCSDVQFLQTDRRDTTNNSTASLSKLDSDDDQGSVHNNDSSIIARMRALSSHSSSREINDMTKYLSIESSIGSAGGPSSTSGILPSVRVNRAVNNSSDSVSGGGGGGGSSQPTTPTSRVRVSSRPSIDHQIQLKAGEWFGEIALLTGCVRTANVIADTPVRLATFDRHAFEKVLGNLKDIKDKDTHNIMLSRLPVICALPPEKVFKRNLFFFCSFFFCVVLSRSYLIFHVIVIILTQHTYSESTQSTCSPLRHSKMVK